MTKFTDRLENDLSHIADQASPSSTAWDAIQRRMNEPEPNNARDIIMLTDEREQVTNPAADRRWLAVAAAIAIGVLAIGAFALGRGDDEDLLVTDDPPEEVVDGDVEEDSAPVTSLAPVDEASPLLPGLPASGLVEVDLGMTMTFDLPVTMTPINVQRGGFALSYQVDDFSGWVFAAGRVGGWYDAEQSIDAEYRGEGSIEANDVEGWIEANQHIAERLPDANVSGRIARVFDIQVDRTVEGSLNDDCVRCVLGNSNSSEFFDPAEVGEGFFDSAWINRLWFIEVEGFDPIAIWAIGLGRGTTYLDEFEATILPTIEIGPDAGPLSVLEAGPTSILQGRPLPAGSVQSDLLGEPFTMNLPENMTVLYARPGEMQLTVPRSSSKFLVIARVGGWYSGTEAIDDTYRGEGSIDPGDPQAWIDDNGLIGEQRPESIEVSGRSATVWDISVDPVSEGSLSDDCPRCRLVFSVSSEFFDPVVVQAPSRAISADVKMRMFFFEGIDGADPIVFIAAGVGEDPDFLDEFEQDILPTIQFESNE